jgi:xylose isomerase
MFHAYILAMDAYALGLINAAKIIEDGRIDAFVEEKYSSFKNTETGRRILAGEATLEELAARAEELGTPEMPKSGRQEYLQGIVNNIMFRG